MDVSKLGTVITSNDWGTAMATGDMFYRMLFKYEKMSVLKAEEARSMLASYKAWKAEIDNMTSECHSNSTFEDRKAIMYAETLVDDVLKHIETILTTVKCEDENFLKVIVTKMNDAQPMAQ